MSAHRSLRPVAVLGAAALLALTGCATTLDHTATIGARGKVSISRANAAPTATAEAGKAAHGVRARRQSATVGGPHSRRAATSQSPTGANSAPVVGGSRSAPVGVKPAPPVRFSQGVTPTTIKIGAFIASYEGLEAKGLNLGNARVQAQAVADYINKHGGIAGRKVVLTFATMQATSNNWEADEQKICTQFTEDDHVFAVVYSLISMGKALLPCLAQHNTPLIAAGGGPGDAQTMQQYADDYVYSGGMNLTRVAETYVDRLAAQGFFGGGAKVGLVRANDTSFARAANALKSRLAGHGVQLTREVVVDAQTSVSGTASQMPNAVLKMQQAGVNRVLFLDNATLAVLFAIQAAGQNYYPRYGLSSLSAPATLLEPNVPARALAGAVGTGWIPTLDVSAAQETPNPAMKLCKQIMVAAGEGNVSRAGENQQRLYCDGFFFLQRALGRATELTPRGLRDQLEQLGTRYPSAITFSTSFGPGRHDGAAAVRDFAFTSGCSCFRYTSRPTKA